MPPSPHSPTTSPRGKSPPISPATPPPRSGSSACTATAAGAWPTTRRATSSTTRSCPADSSSPRTRHGPPPWPASAPTALWASGSGETTGCPSLTASAVAVTGSRNPTEQAIAHTHAFAAAVAEAGHTVTATLAYGVDAAAHRAAAQAGRATLAVLPRGLDRAHPHDQVQLMSSIRSHGGAVVSLYRPGTEASGATLKAGAALFAALARAVILIEAPDHSVPAMHTAQVASDLNRPLLAPPATEDVRANGSARLLAEQRAVLCPDPARALALL
ncbi:DNA-processing protein DprA [Streptomyces sp. NPDC015127]|uniref:DNA-processing protein DprA n=1 Tax=Streptomyces sp. NPDC015127 TaxID=3364939 RepID=UPI0036FFFE12